LPDEPGEAAVVKTVLIQHVELDSKVTLGVFCNQIVPPDDPMGDEDPAQSCTEQERMLIDTLLKVTCIL